MIQGVTSSFCGSLCLPINGDDHIVLVCYGCCDRVPQAWGLTQWKLMVSQFWKLEVLGQDVGRVGSTSGGREGECVLVLLGLYMALTCPSPTSSDWIG